MTFTNSILAGTTLVRQAIKSENYVTGASGWQITRDGDAEFNNLISRGEFTSVGATQSTSIQGGSITVFTNSIPDPTRTEISSNVITLVDANGVSSQLRQQTIQRYIGKDSDTTIISDSTVNDDPHLLVPVDNNSRYAGWGHLIYSSATAADFKGLFLGPAGATLQMSSCGIPTTTDTAFGTVDVGVVGLGTDFQIGGGGVGVKRSCFPKFTLHVGATAGDLQFSWAQVVSTASNTILYAGSWFVIQRVANG